MLRAAIYARYSSDNQRHESIETQYRICEDYCRQKGYLVVTHYKDEAKTGTMVAKRDGFAQMKLDAGLDIWDVLVVYTLDRTARQELDYYLYKQELLAAGVRYEYATESFDPGTVDGQFFEGIQVAQAAWYSRKLSVKIKDGKETNAKDHLFPGGKPPFGYDVTPEHEYVLNQGEAVAVRAIFEQYNNGHSYGDIMNWLNARGYRTKNGQLFGKNSLYDLLANPKYAGTYIYRRHATTGKKTNSHRDNPDALVYTNAVPAIISAADFARAQERKKANKNCGIRNKSFYLLSGLVRCGECGHAMSGNSVSRSHYRYEFYQCTQKMTRGVAACPNIKIKKQELEEAVIAGMLKIMTVPNLDMIITQATEKIAAQLDDTAEDAATVTAKISGLNTKLNNIYNVIESGAADEFDLARLADIKKQITVAREHLAQINAFRPTLIDRDEVLAEWSEFVPVLKNKKDPQKLRTLLGKFISTITVFANRITVQVALHCSEKLVALMGIEPMISP
jgi:site-specific DNA recombinase